MGRNGGVTSTATDGGRGNGLPLINEYGNVTGIYRAIPLSPPGVVEQPKLVEPFGVSPNSIEYDIVPSPDKVMYPFTIETVTFGTFLFLLFEIKVLKLLCKALTI